MISLLLIRALHLAIIHNHQDVVLQLLDVLPQLPPTETPVVDCLNNLKQVCVSTPHNTCTVHHILYYIQHMHSAMLQFCVISL